MFKYLICVLLSLFFTLPLQAKNLATISYKGKSGPVNISISVKEFTKTWKNLRQIAPNTPSAPRFYEEYLRYKLGVEAAYNDPSLVKSPSIRNMFKDPVLKEAFEDTLYKHLAEKKLGKKIARLDKSSQKLSKNTLLRIYKKNPEFEIKFIIITMPIGPNAKQVAEAKTRVTKIHNDVKRSKKKFVDLIDIYSDDRISGKLRIPRNRHSIYPTIYNRLKKMKPGQISSPIRAANSFYIVKLIRQIPFGQANRAQIKATHFNSKRSQALVKYFNGLKSKYKVKTNKALLNSIR